MWSETDCDKKQTKQTTNNLKSCKQKIIVHFFWVCAYSIIVYAAAEIKMCPLQEIMTTLVE